MKLTITGEKLEVSDGYHTIDELYEHRITLFIALCRLVVVLNSVRARTFEHPVWRSRFHSSDKRFEGWFLLGIGKEPGEQITYHIPDSKWHETDFAITLSRAPEWDGHTSDVVLGRLSRFPESELCSPKESL